MSRVFREILDFPGFPGKFWVSRISPEILDSLGFPGKSRVSWIFLEILDFPGFPGKSRIFRSFLEIPDFLGNPFEYLRSSLRADRPGVRGVRGGGSPPGEARVPEAFPRSKPVEAFYGDGSVLPNSQILRSSVGLDNKNPFSGPQTPQVQARKTEKSGKRLKNK